jgi:hypothetical protein
MLGLQAEVVSTQVQKSEEVSWRIHDERDRGGVTEKKAETEKEGDDASKQEERSNTWRRMTIRIKGWHTQTHT